MAGRSYSLINQLLTSQTEAKDSRNRNFKIKVRMTRLREVYSANNKAELFQASMVLIDEEGDYVHATISSAFWDRFRHKIIDGKVHIIKNFNIVPNLVKYRVVGDSKIMIKFYNNTFAKAMDQEEPTIPLHKFDFVQFHNLETRRDNNDVLTDLCGLVVNEIVKGNYFAVEIEDQAGQRLRVALWDGCISDYQGEKEKHAGANEHMIAIFSSLLVREYKGFNSVSSSNTSRIYINQDLPEVNTLRAYLRGDRIDVRVARAVTHDTEKDIASIVKHCQSEYKQDLICSCTVKVTDIIAQKAWSYKSCYSCTTRPQFKDTVKWCYKCEKKIEAQTLRYCFELEAKDKSGTANFVVFDNEARRVIGLDAESLEEAQPLEDPDDEDHNPTPQEIYDNFKGKVFTFKIKVQHDNHGGEQSSYRIVEISEPKGQTDNQATGPPGNETRAENKTIAKPKRRLKKNMFYDSEDEQPFSTTLATGPEENETTSENQPTAKPKRHLMKKRFFDSEDEDDQTLITIIKKAANAKKAKGVTRAVT